MKPFLRHRGTLAPLDRAHVDTDQIVPKQFLTAVRRSGFEAALFHGWRFGPDGRPDPRFEWNAPAFRGASVLVTRENFGCGSSREHAVWALMQYGFRAVLAPGKRGEPPAPAFAEIFRQNAVRNGLLPAELEESAADALFAAVSAQPGIEVTVDLAALRVFLHTTPAREFSFRVDAGSRAALMEGLDPIEQTLRIEPEIAAFERARDADPFPIR